MVKLKYLAAVIAGCLLLITACSKSDDSEVARVMSRASAADSLLEYVPANTPFLLANLQAPPDAVQDKLEKHADMLLRAYQKLLRAVVAENAAALSNTGDDESAERLVAIAGSLAELMTLEGLRNAGIGRDSAMVLYGAGLLPVLRINLTDGDLFEAAMQKIEKDAGQSMDVGSLAGQSYRYAGDDEAQFLIAVVGDDLVISLVPAQSPDDILKFVLGLALPEESIADSEILANLQSEYQFTPYYLGFLDVTNIADVFLSPQSGANAYLLNRMNYDPDTLSDVCRAEIRSMAAIAPRLVTGYTEFSEERLVSNSVVELRPDIAAGLAALTAPVPGLGQPHGGLLTFGISLNMLGARDFYAARLDAMEENPFRCEHFAELQAGVAKGREILRQPIPPIVYDFKGFLAVVNELEGLDLTNEVPPTSIDMWLLLAMDNIEGLVAMGALFSPELAGLNLQTDGKVVPLNLPQLNAAGGPAFAAMTKSALAISLGEGMESNLPGALKGSPSDPSPFMSTEMDAGRYYAFLAEVMSLQGEGEGEGDAGGPSPATKEAMQEIMKGLSQVLDRVRVDVHFTKRGIELPSAAVLKE